MNDLGITFDNEFCDAFATMGSPHAECDCGMTHVCVDSNSWDDDDYEMIQRYKELSEEELKVEKIELDHHYDTFSILEINGKNYVWGCECEGWRPAMNFILRERFKIAQFLIEASDEITRVAEMNKTLNRLKGIN